MRLYSRFSMGIAPALLLFLVTCTGTNSSGPEATSDVDGFVKNLAGEPLAGVTVVLSGKAAVTTAGDGSFSVQDVETPYDATVASVSPAGGVIYTGLTKSDPVLIYPDTPAPNQSASITGSVPVIAGSNDRTLLFFVSGSDSWSTFTDIATYQIDVNWYGTSISRSGTLYYLRWTVDAFGFPLQYDFVGMKPVTVTSGATETVGFTQGDFLTLLERNVSGSVDRINTSSYQLTRRAIYVEVDNSLTLLAEQAGGSIADLFGYKLPFFSTSTGSPTSAVIVDAEQLTFSDVRTTRYSRREIPGDAVGLVFTLQPAALLSSPFNNGAGISTSTQFSWNQTGSGYAYLVSMIPSAGSNPRYYILTTDTRTTIPDFSDYGVDLPSLATYSWYVQSFYPVSSVDDLASDEFIKVLNSVPVNGGVSKSETYLFTTRP